MKSKVHHEFLELYNRHIFYTNDLAHLERVLKRTFKKGLIDYDEIPDFDENTAGNGFDLDHQKIDKRKVCWVLYAQDFATPGDIGHEANHVKSLLFKYMGIEGETVEDNEPIRDEPEAYMIGHLIDTFLENIRGQKPYKQKDLK